MNISQFQQESSYNGLFKKSNTVMFIVKEDNLCIIDANDAACAFYDYSYEDMTGRKLKDIDIDIKENIKDLLHRNIAFITRHRTSAGSIIDIKAETDTLVLNDEKYFIIKISDITSHKYTLTHIINHNMELEIVLNNLPFVAWFKNVQGRYTIANKHMEAFCGHGKNEIIGHTDYDIFSRNIAEENVNNDSEILSGRMGAYTREFQIKGKWREEYKTPVYDRKGEIIGTVGFNRDITGRKQKDRALKNAALKEERLLRETIELKDNFITLITHEFKTPIAVINAALQTMELVCENELGSRSLKYLDKIKQNSNRLQRLVDNMLDITRLKAGRMKLNYNNIEVAELTREITESVKAVAHRKGIKVCYKTDLDELWISIDDEKYERILLNLLSNAIKFTPANKHVFVRLSIEGFFLKLEVKDQGIGIEPDKQAAIFDKFEQADNTLSRQAEGTGIGLYLVKSFTEALGGTVSLVSKTGRGSTFTILIPLQEEAVKKQDLKKKSIRKYVSKELSDIL